MRRFMFLPALFILGALPALAQSTPQGAGMITPPALGLVFNSNCDNGVAVYRMRNQGERWRAQAMITFMSENGGVLFQRAMRLAKNQTMAYRVKKPAKTGAVVAIVDYPGAQRVHESLGQPCS